MQSDLVEIGALWKSKDKNGQSYLSGKMGNARLLVFANKKEKDSQPDYRVYVAPIKRDDESKPTEADIPF